jgi:hypothetical protein
MYIHLHKYKSFFFLFPILILVFILPKGFAQESIRIMAYNMYNYSVSTRDAYFISVLEPIKPDIIVGIEIKTSGDWPANFRDNVLNQIGNGTYNMGTLIGGGSNNNAIYYKPDKFTFVSATNVAGTNGNPRTYKFILIHNSTTEQIIIFGVHMPSGSDAERVIHASAVRTITDAYASGEYFIAVGDYNFVDATEDSFNDLVDNASSGYFIDPEGYDGTSSWSGNTLLFTSNIRNSFNRRKDMILNSQSVVNSGGIEYVPNSFTIQGNVDGTKAGVPQVYKDASDHLPVYADYYFSSPAPGSIVFTQVGADNNDVIEFITLVRMDLTKLKITNSEINSSGELVNGNGTFDLSDTPWKDIPGGTFVRLGPSISGNDDDPTDRIIQYDGSGTNSTVPDLSTGSVGDQLIAYTGSSSSPHFIAGITWGNDGWATSPSNSFAPGTTSDISLGPLDNYYFNVSIGDVDADATRSAVTNSSNWAGSNTRFSFQDLTDNIGNGALPVELSLFTGVLNGDHIDLYWKTEIEVNNYGFNIERYSSSLGTIWETIGFVEGHGNSNSPKFYTFADFDIHNSETYNYRLKQIDNDGTYEYSRAVTVEVDVPNNFYISQNYPNPFNPETRIDFSVPENQMVSLKVYNVLGELVAELVNEIKEAGSYSVTFNASSAVGELPSGIYIYRLETSSFVANKKMTLIK